MRGIVQLKPFCQFEKVYSARHQMLVKSFWYAISRLVNCMAKCQMGIEKNSLKLNLALRFLVSKTRQVASDQSTPGQSGRNNVNLETNEAPTQCVLTDSEDLTTRLILKIFSTERSLQWI